MQPAPPPPQSPSQPPPPPTRPTDHTQPRLSMPTFQRPLCPSSALSSCHTQPPHHSPPPHSHSPPHRSECLSTPKPSSSPVWLAAPKLTNTDRPLPNPTSPTPPTQSLSPHPPPHTHPTAKAPPQNAPSTNPLHSSPAAPSPVLPSRHTPVSPHPPAPAISSLDTPPTPTHHSPSSQSVTDPPPQSSETQLGAQQPPMLSLPHESQHTPARQPTVMFPQQRLQPTPNLHPLFTTARTLPHPPSHSLPLTLQPCQSIRTLPSAPQQPDHQPQTPTAQHPPSIPWEFPTKRAAATAPYCSPPDPANSTLQLPDHTPVPPLPIHPLREAQQQRLPPASSPEPTHKQPLPQPGSTTTQPRPTSQLHHPAQKPLATPSCTTSHHHPPTKATS
ncbi:hypothetical protein CesoFtcFv8_001525 [Champsocephalus esox]|uniref:Uncharacterized protein n=1 Tax=Champsocephalus esox TaxID=159716 RepID=A0AAN8HHJ5_9TELE|nr:hypothetical protein CesoFtcFv8_001525 [Champsocephalus esox]